MKSLLLLRHAKSSWKDHGLGDHDRPLKKRGKRDAPRMGQLLAAQGLVPDLIVTSSAERARATAAAAAEAAGHRGEVRVEPRLYLAEPDLILALLRAVPNQVSRLLIVGHNPGLESLCTRLTGEAVRLPTGALAHLELPRDRWEDLAARPEARLSAVWRPKELD